MAGPGLTGQARTFVNRQFIQILYAFFVQIAEHYLSHYSDTPCVIIIIENNKGGNNYEYNSNYERINKETKSRNEKY